MNGKGRDGPDEERDKRLSPWELIQGRCGERGQTIGNDKVGKLRRSGGTYPTEQD